MLWYNLIVNLKQGGNNLFYSRIKEIRTSKKITQEELSHMTEISQSYLSKIENGKQASCNSNDNSNASKIIKIAKALDCCPACLYGINCNNCEIRLTLEDRVKCRNDMIEKGYNPRVFILE